MVPTSPKETNEIVKVIATSDVGQKYQFTTLMIPHRALSLRLQSRSLEKKMLLNMERQLITKDDGEALYPLTTWTQSIMIWARWVIEKSIWELLMVRNTSSRKSRCASRQPPQNSKLNVMRGIALEAIIYSQEDHGSMQHESFLKYYTNHQSLYG